MDRGNIERISSPNAGPPPAADPVRHRNDVPVRGEAGGNRSADPHGPLDAFQRELPSRPVLLLAHLAAQPALSLPSAGPAHALSPRHNLTAQGWDAAAEPAEYGLCPVSLQEMVRPLWLPGGDSVDEGSFAQVLSRQRTRGVGMPEPLPGAARPKFSAYTDLFAQPCDLRRLRRNWSLSWRLDNAGCPDRASLHHMALQGDAEALQVQLQARSEPAVPFLAQRLNAPAALHPSRPTPLALAAKWGRRDAVAVLLQHAGVAVDAADAQGATPLWLACDGGHLEVARLLLQHGADPHRSCAIAVPNTMLFNALAPLGVALIHGHCDMVALLCGSGAAQVRPLAGPSPALLLRRLHPLHQPECGCAAALGLLPADQV